MKENKGFTLIELLAVIVILAIIALIATPMILGVIETAKKGASESSALGYIDAVEKQVAINELDSTKEPLNDGIYEISELKDTEYGITVKGDAPDSGWIYIQDGVVSNYSFVIDDYVITKGVDSLKGDVADKKPICIKATKLHIEGCTQTSTPNYCSGAGYVEGNKGTTITYGTIVDGKLKSGDAFDCDVNGDNEYDPEAERFYYVTDLEEDNNYAVLIYYNNTKDGIADNTNNSLIEYDKSNENWHGPVTAISNLPKKTSEQWGNISLFSILRTITNEKGNPSTVGGNIPNFNYEGYAARLLTTQELVRACNGVTISYKIGELDNCNYLIENTRFSNNSMVNGYWLETPVSSNANIVWAVSGGARYINNFYTNNVAHNGIRPVIEVNKNDILY